MRLPVAIFGTLCLVACASFETANFAPGTGQETLVRDGNPAVISKKPGSIVIVRPASRQFEAGRRPSYVVGLFNPGKVPLQFVASTVTVEQALADGKVKPLKVFSYDELVAEEKSRQALQAFAVGLSVAANAMNAANAGRYSANGTVYGPYGNRNFTVTGYDPAAASIAQSNAAAVNSAMIDNAIQAGQANLAALERQILKDDTILTGEWYGGRIVFEAPAGEGAKHYKLTVLAGTDQHDFDIAQVKVAQ